MEYLIRWRMLLAGRLLNSADAVSAIAHSLGYESESVFGFAFKSGQILGRDGKKVYTGIYP